MPNEQYADVRCEVCKKQFGDGDTAYRAALKHVQTAHSVTRQQVQNERKLHGRKR